jgi:predicted dehydrogenase
MIGIGVVGVGEMGKRHAENVRRHVSGARLVAIADANLERAKQVAAELEIETYCDSVEALVARKEINAIVIVSPPKFHPQAIQVAAAAKKHILCEKPLALTLDQADVALEAVAKNGVILQMGHMRRYDPSYVEAMKRIQGGEIGDPIIFKAIGRDAQAPPPSYFQSGANGILLLDSSVHEFDLARWLMRDEVVEVQAYTATLSLPELVQYGYFDSAVANLRFGRGAIGNVESFMNARYGYDIRTEVIGTKGALQIGRLWETGVQVLTEQGCGQQAIKHWLVRFADAYLLEMRDFVETVRSGAAPRVTGRDGRAAIAIALAAEKSSRESRAISVDSAVRVSKP